MERRGDLLDARGSKKNARYSGVPRHEIHPQHETQFTYITLKTAAPKALADMTGYQFIFKTMKNTPRNQQDEFLCDFLRRMLKTTDDKQEVERAVNALNDSLYEYGFELSMSYDSRDGSASIVG